MVATELATDPATNHLADVSASTVLVTGVDNEETAPANQDDGFAPTDQVPKKPELCSCVCIY